MNSLLSKILLLPINFYIYIISPLLPKTCRFFPSCSLYARDAVLKHGPYRGTIFAVKRLLKCHPWNPGGYDPVP